MLTLKAYAKINIVLEVLQKRDDDYHDIASIIQVIDIYDTLSFISAPDIELICNKPELNSSDNLIVQAAKLLQKVACCEKGVTIYLQKKIPVAAGLGGGSSDAAATLLALNKLWDLNFSISQLHHFASTLGSDVPFFLYGNTALVEGRGDWVTPLPSPDSLPVIILHPDITVANKTREMYFHLDASQFTSGHLAYEVAEQLQKDKDISSNSFYNVFDTVASQVFPGHNEYIRKFLFSGAATVHLAGSGPAMFTVMSNQNDAEIVTKQLQQSGLEAYLTRTLEN